MSKNVHSCRQERYSQTDSLPVRMPSLEWIAHPKITNQAQRTQSPARLTVPRQGVADAVGAVLVDDAEPLEDLEDETVMVERVEAGAAVLLLVAAAVTVT